MNIFGITSNKLKVIAILSMIIDHLAFYFYNYLPVEAYVTCRIIGRLAMPIFVYLIVKGFFHTSDYKRYLTRLFRLAIYTQIFISILAIVNDKLVPMYQTTVYLDLNILFSFVLILIFLKCIENVWEKEKILLSATAITIILLMYKFLPIDYSYLVLILAVVFYLAEKVKDNRPLVTLILSIGMAIGAIAYPNTGANIQLFSILALPLLLLYNNELGKKSIQLQRTFYSIFLIQHVVLYSLALLVNYWIVL